MKNISLLLKINPDAVKEPVEGVLGSYQLPEGSFEIVKESFELKSMRTGVLEKGVVYHIDELKVVYANDEEILRGKLRGEKDGGGKITLTPNP